ncbi:MAG: response regulator [Candidatus Dadabacteria bacterium]|nr:MAG: response regulator [Candidatus Dadabacteria bacterium]
MGSPVVLVVEDNPAHAELVERCLAEAAPEARVVRAADGAQALAYLEGTGAYADRGAHPLPSLVLLDLCLPGIQGAEVLERVKADPKLRAIPMVVLTTSCDRGDLEGAYERHANGYVVKPPELDLFLELVRDLAAFWLRWNRSHAAGPDVPLRVA